MTSLDTPPPGEPAATDPVATAPQAGRALVERTVLDEQVAAGRQGEPLSWGVRSWLGPLICLAALIVLSSLAAAAVPAAGTGRTVGLATLSIGLQLVLLAVLVGFGRPLAAAGGGWRNALGLDRVRRSDWLPWITGVGFAYLGRTVVAALAVVLTGGRALAEASNISGGDRSVGSIVVLVVAAVVLAPVAEELMFRGLLLRTFMHRMRFWPAAALSTLLFAGFHVYEVDTVAGAITLAASVGMLGLVNCYLVRITGRLTPGIMVHATYNAVAVAVVLLVG